LQYQTNGLPGGTWTDYPGGGTNVVDVTMDTLQSNVYFRLYWPP
jgi:hypothetical protein